MTMSQRAVDAARLDPARRVSTGAGLGSEGGFTIIEVLVAATLLIVSVLATLSMLDRATEATAVSKQRDVANALAQEMIERAAGGRYTGTRNDMTDVDPAAALKGPANRMWKALDPDGDAGSTSVTPATFTNPPQVNLPYTWSLIRKGTRYDVSYKACTRSDVYEGIEIAGPFDCLRPATDPGGGNEGTSGDCKLGLIPPPAVNPDATDPLDVRIQLLGALGLQACVGALSQPLADALCTTLGTSSLLNDIKGSLLGSTGTVSQLLGGGLLSAAVPLCESSITETPLAGAAGGIASSTHLKVTVGWRDHSGRDHEIEQSSLLRRGTAA